MIPNTLIDTHLTSLSEKELKLLLIIIRQTVGWKDKNGERKKRDYISHRYFISATGLSSKSVSTGISLLLDKNLISIENESGVELSSHKQRKGRFRKYYRCLLFDSEKHVKFTTFNPSILRSTKLTPTKLTTSQSAQNNQTQRLSDYERYCQILRDRGG